MRGRRKKSRQGLVEVASLLEDALRQLGMKGDFEKHKVEKKCREVLGEKASRALVSVTLKGRSLQMAFDHSIWMNEVNFRKSEVLQRIQRELPEIGIKTLTLGLARIAKP